MRNLVYKELTLSISKFFFILPILLSLLFFIPQWIYTFVFMYFFWVTVSQIFGGYTAQRDYSFNAMLPVSKKEIVTSKIVAFILIELIHIILGVIFGIVHNRIYGVTNFFMDVNVAFYGMIFVMYGIFNIIFLPAYFKTAYRFGKPTIVGVIATLIFAAFFEVGAIKLPFVYNIMESSNMWIQLIVLVIGIVLYIGSNIVALRKSITNFENIV